MVLGVYALAPVLPLSGAIGVQGGSGLPGVGIACASAAMSILCLRSAFGQGPNPPPWRQQEPPVNRPLPISGIWRRCLQDGTAAAY